MKQITANSQEGRVLLALRPGKMDVAQLDERLPTVYGNLLTKLVRAGLIELNDRCYRITAAGIAACPNRRDAKPEPMHTSRSTMSKSEISQGDCHEHRTI